MIYSTLVKIFLDFLDSKLVLVKVSAYSVLRSQDLAGARGLTDLWCAVLVACREWRNYSTHALRASTCSRLSSVLK